VTKRATVCATRPTVGDRRTSVGLTAARTV